MGIDWLHYIVEEVVTFRPELSKGLLKRDVALLQSTMRGLSESERHVIFSSAAGKALVDQQKLERWFWELSDGNINPKKSAVPGRKFMCMCDFFVAH